MISDGQVRESKLWKRAAKTWRGLMDAQRASDSKAATKVAMEMDRIMKGTAGPEEDESTSAVPMSEARAELHRAFPDLANIGS